MEVYKRDVDVSLIRENLKRTPEERVRNLMRLQREAEELGRAGRQRAGVGHRSSGFQACLPSDSRRAIDSLDGTGQEPGVSKVGDGARYNSRMTVWLRRCRSFAEEAEADREFWAQFSPDERVAMVEQMRREWMEKNGQHDEGLRRTARLLDTARS